MSQPAAARRQRRAPSAPARLELVKPSLTAQEERFFKIARELPPLFLRHHEELQFDKEFALAPDWDRFTALDLAGHLKVTTARFGNVLVGYIFNIIGRHLLHDAMFAEVQSFWLDPAYRGGVFVLRWFKDNDDLLRRNGVRKVVVTSNIGFKDGRVGLIFRRLGYTPQQTIHGKVL